MFWQREKSITIRIAYILSRIFEPFVWIGLFGLAVIFSKYLDGYDRLFWAVELVFFLAGLPIITFWFFLKKGKIEDIDFTKREKRTPFILGVLFYWLLGLILTWGTGGPIIIVKILALALIMGTAVLLINFYYKISNHALGYTTAVLLFNELHGWDYWWLLIFVPVIYWSRHVQKKHTLGQLFLGTILAIIAWLIWRWVN